jgi:hypothetical protein
MPVEIVSQKKLDDLKHAHEDGLDDDIEDDIEDDTDDDTDDDTEDEDIGGYSRK